jgi:hypothetical protein
LEAQMEEKASLNHQLQSELQMVRAGGGWAGFPLPGVCLTWAAKGGLDTMS